MKTSYVIQNKSFNWIYYEFLITPIHFLIYNFQNTLGGLPVIPRTFQTDSTSRHASGSEKLNHFLKKTHKKQGSLLYPPIFSFGHKKSKFADNRNILEVESIDFFSELQVSKNQGT